MGWSKLHNVPLGNARLEIEFTRRKDGLAVRARSSTPEPFCLLAETAPRDQPCNAAAGAQELVLPLPPVEISIPDQLPLAGARTAQLKVVGEKREAHRYAVDFEAPAARNTIFRCA
jgi:hypothetical protein